MYNTCSWIYSLLRLGDNLWLGTHNGLCRFNTTTLETRIFYVEDGEPCSFEVEDNGTGMPRELLDKIFQPFFTTKPTGEGTGLGLSLSYEIVVNGHGGMLSVEEAPGGGAAFVVTLPAGRPDKSRDEQV